MLRLLCIPRKLNHIAIKKRTIFFYLPDSKMMNYQIIMTYFNSMRRDSFEKLKCEELLMGLRIEEYFRRDTLISQEGSERPTS